MNVNVIQFGPYQEKKTRKNLESWANNFIFLCKTLPKDNAQHIFIDKIFTSFQLLLHFTPHNKNDKKATGTYQ